MQIFWEWLPWPNWLLVCSSVGSRVQCLSPVTQMKTAMNVRLQRFAHWSCSDGRQTERIIYDLIVVNIRQIKLCVYSISYSNINIIIRIVNSSTIFVWWIKILIKWKKILNKFMQCICVTKKVSKKIRNFVRTVSESSGVSWPLSVRYGGQGYVSGPQ